MRRYDYSFLKTDPIPGQTISLLNTFEAKYGDFKLLLYKYPQIFDDLKKIAVIQSVQSSNAIEGIITSDERIKKLIESKVAPKNHDEKEILGYKDALNTIHLNHQNLEIDNIEILKLHEILLSYLNVEYVGKFKTRDNAIVEIDKSGLRRLRFKPISAKETPESMEQVNFALLEAINDSNISLLLLIPCYILDFLCIHPFSDGNGRLSRLLTTLLMYKAGYDFVKFVSFENQINLYKKDYYDALKYSSLNWQERKNDYFYFVDNFLLTLIRTLNEIEKRFSILVEKKITKIDRIKETILNSTKPIGRQEIMMLWPDISLSTLEKTLTELQKQGIIIKVGSYRNAKYIKK